MDKYCRSGKHRLADVGVYTEPTGRRVCRACRNDRNREYRQRAAQALRERRERDRSEI